MNRRDFVKGMLGTAVVATLPAPVITAITKTVTKDIEEKIDGKYVFKEDNVLFLIKDGRVLGRTYQFTLSIVNPLIDTTSVESEWREFERGPITWKIEDVIIYAINIPNAKELIRTVHEVEPMDIVIITPNHKITGQVFAEQADYIMAPMEPVEMTLAGDGQVHIEPNENNKAHGIPIRAQHRFKIGGTE